MPPFCLLEWNFPLPDLGQRGWNAAIASTDYVAQGRSHIFVIFIIVSLVL